MDPRNYDFVVGMPVETSHDIVMRMDIIKWGDSLQDFLDENYSI